ncbi:MAG: hypothetical protein IJP37_06115, partial [Clostridia bacterium]|nr:hypothetical protein [Clostridia bacterium]
MSDYKNKNYGRRSREEDTPVTFRDGEPVYRSEKKRSFGRSYDEGGQRAYGERKNRRSYEDRPYGEDKYEKKSKYGDDKYSYDKKKKYDDDKYSFDKKKKYDDDKYSYDKKKKYDDDKYADKKRKYDDDKYADKKRKYDDDKYADKKRKYEEKSERAEVKKEVAPEDLPYILMGRNAVREAIKAGRSIDRILVVEEQDGSLGEIINMARDRNLIIRE